MTNEERVVFEEKLALAIQFNKERVANKFVGQIATRDLIKTSELSEDDIDRLASIYPLWEIGKPYIIGDLLSFEDKLYQVIQNHTSQSDWTPDVVPALFKSHAPDGVVAEWVQPTGGHDAYNTGDKVIFEGQTYESLIDANTWSPTTYPQGWKLI